MKKGEGKAMKKDIEWLKAEVEKQDIVMDKGYIYTDDLMSIINEVDEPELLSKEWINEHKVSRINNLRKMTMSDVVPVDKLQDLLVPKQVLPVIPKWVADNIESKKRVGTRLNVAMSEFPEFRLEKELGIDEHECNELYARAWLDGFTVEDEQKYYVMNEENELILGWSQSAYMTPCIEGYEYMKYNGRENLFQLTEHEIKDYDERYWTFAKPVEELEK